MFHIKIVEHQCREEEKNLTDGEEKEGQSCLQRARLLLVVGDTLVFLLNEYLIDLNKAKLKCSPW